MRSGGEPTSVLWADTAAISASSLSPPLASSAPAMNCFEGLPHHPHHHHLHATAANIHHHRQTPPPPPPTHVIRLLPASSSPTATEAEPTSNGEPSSPAPRQEAQQAAGSGAEEDAADREAPSAPQGSSGQGSPSPHGAPEGSVRVKQEAPERDDDPRDDSGISPGSGSGGAPERESEDAANLEDSPGGSSRGGGDRGGQGDDGPRSPYSEGCYSEECEDSADIRRMQYSESAAGGPQYSEGDGQGQRPDASDEDDAGGDVNKPRITSQGKFKTFRCKQCDFVALTKLEFWEHSRMHIRAERLLTCPRCPFVTEYKHHLEYHLRNHFGSKPFKCPHCPYTCVNKSMLNSHLKSHSSVYQYRCADCGYATKYCHSLKLHLRKYSHQPAMVLHPDGSPNPLPVIDVYGTRRGPKTGSKKVHQQQGVQETVVVSGAPNSPPSPPAPTTTLPPAVTAAASVITTTASSGAPFQAMLVYPSSPSPSYANGAGSYYAPASTITSSAYSTPQTSRPILPRVLQPRAEAEEQWHPAREEHPDVQAKKPSGGPPCASSNRPVKCTLCEFASTSREAFAEHMMVHAANGDVGNRDSSTEVGATRAMNPLHAQQHHQQPPPQHQQQSILIANGIVPAQATDAGLKEYLARMLTAVVPRMGHFRGPVPPQLQAQWHAHVQQQMHHQQHYQQQAVTNGGATLHQGQVHHPASPQPIQRPWLSQEAVQTPLVKPTASPPAPTAVSREDEVVAEGMRDTAAILPSGGDDGREGRRLPNGGVPLDLTKESTPRQQSAVEHHLGEERQKGGVALLGSGSSRRKGRAFKLERISRNLQRGEEMEEGGSSGDDEEERQSRHSENDEEESMVDSPSKRRRTMAASEEPKVTKVVRVKEDKEDYHCPYCDIAFRDVVLYTMHMGYHGYQDPFKCNMCGQETNDKVSFFLHIARSSHS
ncbi:protein hunchback [Ischnura elegans]|uniref:protein hunchback n=1 Tax=Ischnura elegans TaxID=197161 RepID=UPI001ED895E1|nr:protein hunchback [Ischnura elegans]